MNPDLTAAGSGRRRSTPWSRPAKLNGVDPQAWLADVLARLPDHPAKRIGDLLPWNWKAARDISSA